MKSKQKTQKYLGPHQVTYVPLRLSAKFNLPKRAWNLAPGLWIQRLSDRIKDDLIASESKVKPHSGINPNYAIKIDSIAYGDYILTKIANEGKTIPDYPKDLNIIGVECINITKMILIALLLQNNLKFAFANKHSYEVLPSDIYDERYMGFSAYPREEMSYTWWFCCPSRPSNVISPKVLSKTLDSIEIYYRPLTWEVNRISTALCYFWSALIANESNQFFTNLTILLECLLSTDRQELAHKVSERAAIILGKNNNDRLTIYKDIKKIYNQRSKIVHGEGVPAKGRLHSDMFMVTPKYTFCPKNLMSRVISISIDLLNTLLKDDEYVKIVRSAKTEKKKNGELNDLFMKRLFHC